jgi:hypothetical protein
VLKALDRCPKASSTTGATSTRTEPIFDTIGGTYITIAPSSGRIAGQGTKTPSLPTAPTSSVIAPASSVIVLNSGVTGLICAQTAGHSGVTGTLYVTTTNGGRDAL